MASITGVVMKSSSEPGEQQDTEEQGDLSKDGSRNETDIGGRSPRVLPTTSAGEVSADGCAATTSRGESPTPPPTSAGEVSAHGYASSSSSSSGLLAGEQRVNAPSGPHALEVDASNVPDLPQPEEQSTSPSGRWFTGLRVVRGLVNGTASAIGQVTSKLDDSITSKTIMANRLPALMIVPKCGCNDKRIILYLHGGAHCVGSPWLNRCVAVQLGKVCDAKVFSLDYSLAPDHPFPAGLQDTLEAWQWLRQQFPDASIAIAGASAGGNLCFALLVKLAQRREQQPVACIGISPWLQLDSDDTGEANKADTSIGEFVKDTAIKCVQSYCQGHPSSDPLVSPCLASDDLIQRFPPCLLHASEGEYLARDVRGMGKRCSDNGILVETALFPGSTHVFQQHQAWQQTKDSFSKMGEFLSRAW